MIKLFLTFIALCLVGYVSIFLIDEPGQIIVEWHGWIIESTVSVIIILTFITIIIFYYSLRFLFSLIRFPKKLKTKFIKNRNKRGISALYTGIAAVLMNEKDLAELHYKKTKKLLNKNPLKLILEMGILKSEEQLNSDNSTIRKMLSHSETRLLALKYLIEYHIKNKNVEQFLKLSKLIPKKKDTPNWFYEKLLLIEINKNNWVEVFSTLKLMYKFKKITDKEQIDLLGKLYFSKSLYEQTTGDINLSLKSLSLSLKYIPDFSPAIKAKAELLHKKDTKKALKYAEELWAQTPNNDLLDFFLIVNKNYTPLKLLNYINSISNRNKYNFYNNFALAELAIKAKAWPKARSTLDMIPKDEWTKNIYIMMSKIESMGHGNLKMSNTWLERSQNAEVDLCWGCMTCSYASKTWHLICPKCNNINKMKWDRFYLHEIEQKSENKVLNNNKKSKKITTDLNPENAARGILDDLKSGIDR